MATGVTKSYGTVMSYSSNGSSYTDLTAISEITPPKLEAADMKVSDLASASYTHEYLAGWKEPGEVPFTGYFTKAQFATLYALVGQASDLYYWRIEFPLIGSEVNNSKVEFRGHLKSAEFEAVNIDDDGKIMCPFVVKVSGLPTFTAGA